MPAAADILPRGNSAKTASRRAFLGAPVPLFPALLFPVLLFGASMAITIAWCTAMVRMGALPMPGGWSLSMAWLPICGQTWAGAAASFIGMWAVMMVAMMLPSLTPALWRGRPASGALRPLLLMAMGYFLVWILPGAIVFPVGAGFAELLQRHPALARAVPVLAGCVVAGAGLLQFTAWKARHLARCRRMADDRLPMGAGAALRRGLRLGRHCTCSCAGFTAVLLAIGVMDLRAMALIMAAITAERLAGDGIARSIGAVLLAAGLLLIARAAGLG
ncbi:MAG TPA: DUF2182 domain-containing protein [Ferrovibrio sp.]|jgi:predicted metal-binding membrane protein|uniref:DUF2182 domain-containing protein n=1 Tax=Ferrovibrio sp. TaxID=1917215 RepID=UPI002ED1D01E